MTQPVSTSIPERRPDIQSVKVKMNKQATNWKDYQAGYHEWLIRYIMQDGRVFVETLSGTLDDVLACAWRVGPEACPLPEPTTP